MCILSFTEIDFYYFCTVYVTALFENEGKENEIKGGGFRNEYSDL